MTDLMLNVGAVAGVVGVIVALLGLTAGSPLVVVGGLAAIVGGYCCAQRAGERRGGGR